MGIVITDMDDTLADTSWRQDMIWDGAGPDDWYDFFMESLYDPPNQDIVDMVNEEYAEGNEIYILTARDECYREVTEEWLELNNVSYTKLLMRPDEEGEHTPSHEAKKKMLKQLDTSQVLYAMDDDLENLLMYLEQGFDIYPVGISWEEIESYFDELEEEDVPMMEKE